MSDLSYTIDVNPNPAIAGLQKVENKVGEVTKTFSKLQGALLGLFTAGAIKSLLDMADAITDISAATDIAVVNVMGFSAAVEQNGGSIEGAQKSLLKFSQTIGEAAEGSVKAQDAFAKVGISLDDLRKMSEKELLAKTIKQLSLIPDAGKRAAAGLDLMGKGFKGVDATGLQSVYAAEVAGSAKSAKAMEEFGKASDKLAATMQELKRSLITALAPMATFFNSMDPAKITQVIDAAVKLGGALLAIVVIGKGFKFIVDIIASMWGGMIALTKVGTNFGSIIANYAPKLAGFKAAFMAAEGAGAKLAAVFVHLGFIARGTVPVIGKAIVGLLGPLGKVVSILWIVADVIDLTFGTKIVDTFIDKIKEAWEWMKKVSGFGGKAKPEGTWDDSEFKAKQKAAEEEARGAREVKNALQEKINAINQSARAFAEHNMVTRDSINFENSLIGKTEEFAAVQRSMEAVYQASEVEIRKLMDAKELLKDEEKSLIPIYDEQIAKIKAGAIADAEAIGRMMENRAGLLMIEKARLENIDNMNKAVEDQIKRQENLGMVLQSINDQKISVQFESAQAKRSPIQAQFEAIKENARLAALEAGRAISAAFEGMDLTVEQSDELAAALGVIADRYAEIGRIQAEQLTYSLTWDAGWKKAFDNYVENSSNAARVAGDMFDSVTGNMNSAIDNFVTTGKFKFGDFARSVIQDLIKIEMKALMSKVLAPMLSGAAGIFASLFAFAEGGDPPIGKASIIGEKGPELFVPKQAGTVISNANLQALTAAGGKSGGVGAGTSNTYITNNISAVDAKSVAQLFASNRKMLFSAVQMAQKETAFR